MPSATLVDGDPCPHLQRPLHTEEERERRRGREQDGARRQVLTAVGESLFLITTSFITIYHSCVIDQQLEYCTVNRIRNGISIINRIENSIINKS